MACCNGLLIQLKNIPEGTPDWMKPSGKLYLDLSADSGISLGKALGEVSDVNKIADEAAVGLTVPMTKKNRFVLDASINPNAKVEEIRLDVAVTQGGSVIPFDVLIVVNASDESGNIECELRRGADHWIQKASSMFIKDIPGLADVGWPTSPFDIQQHWLDEVPYADGNDGYLLAPVDYSGGVDDDGNTGWMKKNRIIPEDLRPWVSDKYLLEKGFCAIGWNFSSPFYDTDYAAHLFSYLCGKGYGQDPQLLESYQIFAQVAGPIQYYKGGLNDASGVVFEDVTEDGFGALTIGEEDTLQEENRTVTKFRGIGVFDFFAELAISVPPIESTSWAKLQIVKIDEVTGQQEVHTSEEFYFPFTEIGDDPPDLKLFVTWENVEMGYDDSIFVQLKTHITFALSSTGGDLQFDLFINSGSFRNTPRRALPIRGFQTNLTNLLDEKLTFLDFFKGCIFDFDGKIITNYETRTVEVYPPETADLYGEEVEGFYQTTNVPLTDAVCETLTVTNAEASTPRYALIKFKDSNDPAVEAEPTPNGVPLHARLIDRGPNFKEETQEYSNPIFEPTTTGKVQKIFEAVDTSAVDMPRLWDNDGGELSFDVGFRKLYFWDNLAQYIPTTGGSTPAKMRLMNQTISSFPYGFQRPKAYKVGLVLPDERYVYGAENDEIGDHFFLFWRFRALFRDFRTFAVQFQNTLYDYKNLDFRKWYTVMYKDHPYAGRIKGVSNFDLCTGRQEIEFFPASAFIDCPTREDLAGCDNNPKISLIIDDADCCVRARNDDGEITSPIDTDNWKYTTDNLTWNTYTVNTPICGEELLIFARYTTFSDGCPPKGRTKMFTLDEICRNTGVIVIEYDEDTGEVSATGIKSVTAPEGADVWTYSLDGGPLNNYTEGDGIVVPPGSTICFQWSLAFTNCCPELENENCFSVPADAGCSDNDGLNLLLVDQGGCLYLPEIDGTTYSPIGATVFEVSHDGGDTWSTWNGQFIEPEENLKVRAMVFFCDGCAPICLEVDCPQ